jgi:tRNA-(ms[2]io[6]A)-hydroxylase
MIAIAHLEAFLHCETPQRWIDNALTHTELLLIDHANCEKKAASTAINLMYRYVDNFELLTKMSRLAREELRHFEQVIAIMKNRGIEYSKVDAARYAGELHKNVRTAEPGRLIDTLIVGAIIEARSCERFARLAPHLDEELKAFYFSLLKSEARHYQDYLTLANNLCDESNEERIQDFLKIEKNLILNPDQKFRFHSGPVDMGND